MVKVVNVVGARPNFVKIAPLMHEMAGSEKLEPFLLHTGQHYDYAMSESFFKELEIPEPDEYLGVGSASQATQVAEIMRRFDDFTDKYKPGAILVVGDVNSTMACSLVAVKKGIKIIHVEAGIRSRDRSMPEEINRLVTDSLTDLLLPPSQDAVDNLLHEGHPAEKIHLVGNIMIDTLMKFRHRVNGSGILHALGLEPGNFALVTIHRPSNVDSPAGLQNVAGILEDIQSQIKTVFPVHPRTRRMFKEAGMEKMLAGFPNLILAEPLGYFDFGKLVASSAFVVTDSGGIQEETTVYGIPCITLRENTERPITVTLGTNELAGRDRGKVNELVKRILSGNWKKGTVPELWDGKTAARITEILEKYL
ncbi:MAG: UDP-N-acetylglucosamine 2-epimerase (non-hydrolyzing) [Bacteroidales bacterium]|nr:UDP-N-acetylglucosamine 2-epimerase (non-hydrolyzing) [Bacteroidales bacterium]